MLVSTELKNECIIFENPTSLWLTSLRKHFSFFDLPLDKFGKGDLFVIVFVHYILRFNLMVFYFAELFFEIMSSDHTVLIEVQIFEGIFHATQFFGVQKYPFKYLDTLHNSER